ncbi:MAG TPA: pseudaminic acid cytidylyltransferase [Steroidobacteraceae bacterium]
MNLAVIPARGGSKRIPRKNIREFRGKPMIVHSIDCAFQSGLFDRVLVSTDDEEIREVALQSRAEVPFLRPAALSDDHTGTTAVVAHAIEWLQREGTVPAAVCCIYATAPFMRPEDLEAGLRILEAGQWKFVFSATEFPAPVERAFRKRADEGLEMLFPERFDARSQDLGEIFHDAGQFYWGPPQAWLSHARIFDTHSTIVTIPRWRVHDIDTEDDWRRAEAMLAFIDATPDRKART